MNAFADVLPWILIVLGAIITFMVKPILKNKYTNEEQYLKKLYLYKSIGMWLVVIGAVMIFWAGGNFGVGHK